MTVPAPNGQMPAMARNKVDLPAPEGPESRIGSPGGSDRLALSSSLRPFRQSEGEILERQRGAGMGEPRTGKRGAAGGGDGFAEAVKSGNRGAPGHQVLVGGNEPGKRALHIAKNQRNLAKAAKADLVRKVTRQRNDERKDIGNLIEADGKKIQQFSAAHDAPPICANGLEALAKAYALIRFAAIQRDRFRVFSHPHEVIPKVCFHALLIERQRHQLAADQLREDGADDRIYQSDPQHVAGDVDAEQFDRPGNRVQHEHEAEQGDKVGDEVEAEREAAGGEIPQIVGDTLIRVVERRCPRRARG